jgi:hypothetical protein
MILLKFHTWWLYSMFCVIEREERPKQSHVFRCLNEIASESQPANHTLFPRNDAINIDFTRLLAFSLH